MNKLLPIALASAALFLGACAQGPAEQGNPTFHSLSEPVAGENAVGTPEEGQSDYRLSVLLSGLNNPSSVVFSRDGQIAICEAGTDEEEMGRVHLITPAGRDVLTGFPTEFWKPSASGGSYKVGPLSAAFLDEETLLVSNSGLADGQDNLQTISLSHDNDEAAAKSSTASGEGNFVGMVMNSSRDTAYVCGQGSDAETWVLKYDVESKELTKAFSADKNGISVNSPMQCLLVDDNRLLVLYSGTGGKNDGRIVLWNTNTGSPMAEWGLPGLTDPMGMDFIGGSTNKLVVVDNKWTMNQVNTGAIARVTLGAADDAEVALLNGPALNGPVSCSFGNDGRLYVTELGESIDEGKGRVVILDGIR